MRIYREHLSLRKRNLKITVASVTLLFTFLLAPTIAPAQNSVNESSSRERTAVTRHVLVRSKSLLVSGAVVEEKLLQNSDFKRLGFAITRDPIDADLVLELRHDVLTKYVFTVVDAKTLTVIAGGKLSSLNGTVAGKVAKRFVTEMNQMKTP